jgi:hypothetical protein
MKSRNASRRRWLDHRGTLLMSVLVCLSVVMLLATSWLKTITLEQRHVRAAADRAQADYLVASGVARATAQLAADPRYAGETWQIDRETLGMRSGATVVIRLAAAVADKPRQRRLIVEASFPNDRPWRARQTREVTIELSAAK